MAQLDRRELGPPAPWDYIERAAALMPNASTCLDMGTGGGERFAGLCDGYRGRAFATEEWRVNAPIAAGRLGALGIDVVRCSSLRLPFADASFDLVLNRHEALDPAEVARVLRPGGHVLTQQVWWRDNELSRYFPRRTDHGDHFRHYGEGFASAGLEIIDAREHQGPVAYADIGEYVFLLCIAPWEVPDFDPLGADLPALLAMENDLLTGDGLVLTEGRYIIEAHKPA
ncbi:MAG: class I SAM-dependent methyltransferase [Dehalococcoidia bacterium]